MKRILVPTDFSAYAEDALKVAAQIAKNNNAEIALLHMLELPGQMSDATTGGASIPEVMLFMRKAHETFEKIKSSPYLDGIVIREVVQFEKAFSGILNYTKKNEVDLIVMGSHGVAGMEEIFIGSNTEKVVRLSTIPVLVIKKDHGDFITSDFVFASDFSKESKKPFRKMIEFAALFNARINLVMICTPNSFKTTSVATKIMNDFIAEFDISNYTLQTYNDSNIEKGIINFTNSINADLIGICSHGRTGLAHFFNGSITEDLVNHTVKPVITFKI
ncbi:universal stress protein [Flavobacterium restrictum]|uniref:Universal stress protein n=1 Tax=Flavobacterium restrictum TaxID=2594428 RepID=A0A553DY96_9FLAO|nr:universal stress protein [Flavobacterium restrictum]TRX37751.1 universal stress protein [Flavobacterium restrictum]